MPVASTTRPGKTLPALTLSGFLILGLSACGGGDAEGVLILDTADPTDLQCTINLQVMFDRSSSQTLWPQMMGTGVCGHNVWGRDERGLQ